MYQCTSHRFLLYLMVIITLEYIKQFPLSLSIFLYSVRRFVHMQRWTLLTSQCLVSDIPVSIVLCCLIHASFYVEGPRNLFRRIRPRGFVKAFKHKEKILSRINSMIKRDCIRRENQEPKGFLNLYRLVKVSKHCILSCKYGDCTFSNSGQNIRSFEKHLDSCWYILVRCCKCLLWWNAPTHTALLEHNEQNWILVNDSVQIE